jgi:hypothetical protein
MPRPCPDLFLHQRGRLPHSCHSFAYFHSNLQAFDKLREKIAALLEQGWCAIATILNRKCDNAVCNRNMLWGEGDRAQERQKPEKQNRSGADV